MNILQAEFKILGVCIQYHIPKVFVGWDGQQMGKILIIKVLLKLSHA